MKKNGNVIKISLKLGLALCLLFFCSTANGQEIDVKKEFALAEQQLKQMIEAHPDLTKFPFSTHDDGSQKDSPSQWWCSGFFPGSLWYMYEYTGNAYWKTAADKWTKALQKEQYNKTTHDLGFMMYCSYGNGYRLTKNKEYQQVLLNSATSLASRYAPAVGAIKSWDDFRGYKYPVIIDNMMNLELLFWASEKQKTRVFRRSPMHMPKKHCKINSDPMVVVTM